MQVTEVKKKTAAFFIYITVLISVFTVFNSAAIAEEAMSINLGITSAGNSAGSLSLKIGEPGNMKNLSTATQAIIAITLLSLAPSIFILCTSFIRIIIVLGILRQAIGLNQIPPTQILVGFAIFITLFNMYPVYEKINTTAVQPYNQKTISWDKALSNGTNELKIFMLKQTRDEDLAVFLRMQGGNKPASRSQVPMLVVIPSFVLSELKTGFEIGFLLYIPFIVVDMIVASILMSMGMMMLPPMMLSLPFKILLFVMIDGWRLVTDTLMRSFNY